MTSAAAAGTIAIGDLTIHRLGFGAMRVTGRGVMGPPPDMAAARATLHALPELGVDFVDTANAYGPLISELLVREQLHPYAGMVVATKGGCLRPAPFKWVNDGRPEALRMAVAGSCKTLGVDRIDLWQLHRIDDKVPRDEQFGAIAELQRAGQIRHVGLCNVTVDDIAQARAHFTVASVQNLYHVIDRRSEPVLELCERDGIAFIAYYPLATGALALADSVLTRVAASIGITPAQAALAWLLHRSKQIVVIPGTCNPAHLRENVAAADVTLTPEQYRAIDDVGRRANMLRAPRP
ncbi:MAG TPA: aldo/keto reductase [Kofleriaceae bacterium]|nr:aldo/keto reductase [Kofleriaceae bacterium]